MKHGELDKFILGDVERSRRLKDGKCDSHQERGQKNDEYSSKVGAGFLVKILPNTWFFLLFRGLGWDETEDGDTERVEIGGVELSDVLH